MEDNPLIYKQCSVCQRGGDGRASDAQQGNQNEGWNQGDGKPDKWGIKIVFRFACARKIVGQDGVCREEDNTRRNKQNNCVDIAELTREEPLKKAGGQQADD